ncbi:hypothetical protein ACPYPE_23520 [Streptomyces griseus]|uniref:hypothetical protein n=1 Tax=Streptomyces griseus TaxID=1911 RepID=UPI003CF9F7CE
MLGQVAGGDVHELGVGDRRGLARGGELLGAAEVVRIAYVSVIIVSAAVRTAGSVISTRIATSGRVTWERVWWLS